MLVYNQSMSGKFIESKESKSSKITFVISSKLYRKKGKYSNYGGRHSTRAVNIFENYQQSDI